VIRVVSRGQRREFNNQGITSTPFKLQEKRPVRDARLENLDVYYDSLQYKGKPAWDQIDGPQGEYLPVRMRQPKFKMAFAKTLCQRVGAKLLGASVFPTLKIEDSPDDEAYLKAIIKEAKLKARLQEPIRRMLGAGSWFTRFYIEDGAFKFQAYPSKHCYPKFQANDDLESITIKYVYEDKTQRNPDGTNVRRWFKMELDAFTETLFDNPEYKPNEEEPIFQIVSQVEHGMGFVQGEWWRTAELAEGKPDGPSLYEDILEFIDELNYSLSQSSQAVQYNQDPQLVFSKMTEAEMGDLIRSSAKSWSLGREGDAKFLESDLNGVKTAIELRDKVKNNIQDITRVVLLDPEKIVGHAQSAKAMEVLHGPMKDLIDELRPVVGESFKRLVVKMAVANMMAAKMGIQAPIMLPPGYRPMSLDADIEWPPIFQQTMEDLQKKISVTSSATGSNIISRETATRFIAKDFGIENVEEEVEKVNTQVNLNPWSGGF
jgi:hypothetical protein